MLPHLLMLPMCMAAIKTERTLCVCSKMVIFGMRDDWAINQLTDPCLSACTILGLLKTSTISDKEWLPFDKQNASLTCDIDAPVPPHAEEQCVFAGDIRVNQQIGLTTLHLLFLRFVSFNL